MSGQTEISSYKTVQGVGYAEFRDRGSLFLGYVYPFTDAQQLKGLLHELKQQHPKANHYCFAYRIGMDQLQFRANDDGEPSGSAGKPILGQIDNRGLTNVLVVVVRFFGGTLLGVPGLIHAYKTTASLALQVTQEVSKPIMVRYELECSYDLINDVFTLLRKADGEKISLEQGLFFKMEVAVPMHKKEAFEFALGDIHGMAYQPIKSK